ncbi:MAG: damage-inducible protein CinA, partial [Pseudoalteromonas nigrifaciens]
MFYSVWSIKIKRHVFTQRLNMELHQEIKTLAAQLGAILTDK